MKYKFILWDHDGVLVNTEPLYYRANKKVLNEIGIDLSEEEYMFYMQNGISVWKIPAEKNISQDIIKQQRNRRNSFYQSFLKSENIEIPNVINVLEILKTTYSMAIITTSKKEDFELIHKKRKILQYMDFYLTNGDYAKSKPFPDPYITGMNIFKAKAHECIVIEDSARGLKSAIAAGIDCAIIKNPFTKTHDFSGAKYIIDDIMDLPELLYSL